MELWTGEGAIPIYEYQLVKNSEFSQTQNALLNTCKKHDD